VPSLQAEVISSVTSSDIPSEESCFLKVSTPLIVEIWWLQVDVPLALGSVTNVFLLESVLDFLLRVEVSKDTKPEFAKLVLLVIELLFCPVSFLGLLV